VNVDVPVGVAVRVTTVPVGKSAAQVPLAVPVVLVQVMPVGFEATLPLPVPLLVSVRRAVVRAKLVVTVLVTPLVTGTVQGTAVQAPVKLVNVDPLAGVAVSVTPPGGKVALQAPVRTPAVLVQLIPAGLETSVPVPVSVPVIVTVPGATTAAKATVALWAALRVT